MTDVVIKRLTEFKTQLETTNKISVNDVLSIEQAVGSAFITIKTPIGKFSTNRTKTCVNDAIEDTASYIEQLTNNTETPIHAVVTYEELVDVQYTVLRKVTSILNKITKFTNIPQEAISRLVNERYIYTYMDVNRTERTEVLDLTSDRNLLDVFSRNLDYVNGVLVAMGYSQDVINSKLSYISSILDSYNSSSYKEDGTMLPTTPVLLGTFIKSKIKELLYGTPAYHIEYITIRDMIEFFNNINNITNELTILIDDIEHDIANGREANSWIYFNDYKILQDDYKRYSGFNRLLDDEASNTILNIFYSLFDLRK
jgi:hypothetical protein